ncbi:MAG: DUF4440 domain-containing protein [Peptostreptococcaceae bacterium]
MITKISEEIYELENKLLSTDIRKSTKEIKELLDANFTEFCASGKVYNYSEGDTFYEENVSYNIIDFSIIELSQNCILSKYKLEKVNEINEVTYSNRSSVWKNFRGKWKMIFHQGTLANLY